MADLQPESGVVDFAVREHRSLWLDAWRRLIASKTARLGMFIVAVFVLSAVLAHFFWQYDPTRDLDYSLKLKIYPDLNSLNLQFVIYKIVFSF